LYHQRNYPLIYSNKTTHFHKDLGLAAISNTSKVWDSNVFCQLKSSIRESEELCLEAYKQFAQLDKFIDNGMEKRGEFPLTYN